MNNIYRTIPNHILGTNGPMGLDPGGHDFKQPKTPLQSAPPLPTIQCWVPGLHFANEHVWIFCIISRYTNIKTTKDFITLQIRVD